MRGVVDVVFVEFFGIGIEGFGFLGGDFDVKCRLGVVKGRIFASFCFSLVSVWVSSSNLLEGGSLVVVFLRVFRWRVKSWNFIVSLVSVEVVLGMRLLCSSLFNFEVFGF